MGRLLTFVVAAFAFVAFAFGLATAQDATGVARDAGAVGGVTNELGTPCAPPASPVAKPLATPEATPGATPEASVVGGCDTEEATPGTT